MVTAAVVGGLGSGKTATLTFLALNYACQDYDIYSNYKLFTKEKEPFSKLVLSQQDLNNVHDGYFMGDELWSWIDSRISNSNKFVNDILLKSRKRGFNLFYTTQSFHQIDKRIRDVTDYILFPTILYKQGKKYKVIKQNFLKPISLKPFFSDLWVSVVGFSMDDYFFTDELGSPIINFDFRLAPVTSWYDTTEEVEMISKNEVGKGIRTEILFQKELEKLYPKKTKLVENSGLYQDSFDVELKVRNKLKIFDVCTLNKKPKGDKVYSYLSLQHKNPEKYADIEKKRGAITYFSFLHDNTFFVIPTSDVWNMTDKNTLSIHRILPKASKISSLH